MRAIDADALIHELNDSHYPGAPYIDAGISIAIGKVCDAPTIEPQRKKGKWIDETFNPWGLVHHPYNCDQCGEHSESDSEFCPNCGADMRQREE